MSATNTRPSTPAAPPTKWTIWDLLPCLFRKKDSKPPPPTLEDSDSESDYDPMPGPTYATYPRMTMYVTPSGPSKVRLSQPPAPLPC